MKRRLLSLLLCAAMLFALAAPARAALDGEYGKIVLYTGAPEVDFMAAQALKELALSGKSQRERAQAVYRWVVENCGAGEAGKTYFDADLIEALASVELQTGAGAALSGSRLSDMERGEGLPSGWQKQVPQELSDFFKTYARQWMNGQAALRIDFGGGSTLPEPGTGAPAQMSCDENESLRQPARETLLTRRGDSLGYAAVLTAMLGQLGLDCRVIEGSHLLSGKTEQPRFFCRVLLSDGKYFWLDPYLERETGNGQTDRYFLISDDDRWAEEHGWDKTFPRFLDGAAERLSAEYRASAQMIRALLEAQSAKLWSKVSPWAEPYMKEALLQNLYPQPLMGADLTQAITRREFAYTAVLLLTGRTGAYPVNIDETDMAGTPFSDVEDPILTAAAHLGIIKGVGGGRFDPDGTLTREQAATMLGRVCELLDVGSIADGARLKRGSVTLPAFPDGEAISPWARGYVDYFVSHGVINGTGAGAFSPKAPITREQALKIAVEAMKTA